MLRRMKVSMWLWRETLQREGSKNSRYRRQYVWHLQLGSPAWGWHCCPTSRKTPSARHVVPRPTQIAKKMPHQLEQACILPMETGKLRLYGNFSRSRAQPQWQSGEDEQAPPRTEQPTCLWPPSPPMLPAGISSGCNLGWSIKDTHTIMRRRGPLFLGWTLH